ncbi:MAG TPA: OmpA family protein [Gemmatimonadaceae bacterium]|nr:OmpA family protein [Gemmatimonadaceae bacterium]
MLPHSCTRRLRRLAAAGLAWGSLLHAQPSPTVPRVANLALVQTLHIGDTLDRESVVTLVEASSAGVKYRWTFLEVRPNGDTTRSARERFVSAADLDTSSRLYEVYEPKGPLEHPGYTAFTIGGALYEGIRTSGSGAFSMLSFAEDDPARSFAGAFGFGGSQPALVRWRGTLTRQSTKDEAFPLLINGQRVMVPSLHLKADLTSRGEHWAPEIWILAQHDHPLLLKLSDAKRVFQTVRADLVELPTRSGVLEGALVKECRLELPGIYFEFNSAALAPASDNALASLADVLKRHGDWAATIEGHTDSIGGAKSNQLLSARRAEAVRARLISAGIVAARLKAAGFGATRPRETNTTIEGRARNRRVELARECSEPRR